MTTAILATGDEIVHGDTLNTNSHHIAHALSSEGLPLGLHVSCDDKIERIMNCLDFLVAQHDIVIIIGGLGPTSDDLTRFALAQFTHDALVQHQDALDHIQNRLKHAKVPLNEGNIQQCLFPAQARLLPNPNGTAMGCLHYWQNKLFILLPGPPRECLPMFNDHVLPVLQQTGHSEKHIVKWRIFGLPESEIAQTLEQALADFDCQTGYRWDVPYVEFKVRCIKDLVEPIKARINPILAPHIIATVDQKASAKLAELILSMNKPITIIDKATGGLLQTLLEKPGLHHLLNFNANDASDLVFHLNGLQEYWAKEPASGTTQLTIHYSHQKQEDEERHTIPYRNSMVLYYAVEWLSFRLIHLINQLH